jgi:hypothetical protein
MVLFSDGFETNDLSAWTTYNHDTNASIATSNTQKHTGSYSAYVSSPNGAEWGADIEKTIAAQTTAYLRFYIYFTSLPAAGKSIAVAFLTSAAAYGLAGVGVVNDGSTYKWILWGQDTGTNSVLDTDNPTTSTWYCVELKAVKGNGTGEARFYLAGTEKLSLTNQTQNFDIESANVGVWAISGGPTATHYIDCVVVDASYIGPEVTGVTVKKGGNVVGVMAQMLNSKMLFG